MRSLVTMSGLKFLMRTAASSFGILRQQQHVLTTATLPVLYRPTSSNTNVNYLNCYDISSLKNRSICSYTCFGTERIQSNCKYFSGRLSPSSWSDAAYIGRYNFGTKSSPDRAGKSDSKASPATSETDLFAEASKLSLVAKFKLMYKQYWYVLIPVHVVTSFGWLGAFYYMSKSGVDIAAMMQYIHLSESIIQKVQNSNMGHYAIAYLCYKVVTPVRYALTVGSTTFLIKYLVQRGQLKPIPSKKELIKMYTQKKADRAAIKCEEGKKQS